MVYWAILAGIMLGFLSITSACYHWIRKQIFGTSGIILSIGGIILLGMAVWASVEVGKRVDSTAVQRVNAETIAALIENNKQLTDQLTGQLQKFAKEMHDNEDRALSNIQSHILAIRTALNERPAPIQQPRPEGTSAGTKQQPPKTR
jgi:hypothetical protein